MNSISLEKKKAFILDSSTDVTGALKSSLLLANALSDSHNVCFMVPKKSKAKSRIIHSGYDVIEMPIMGLRKKPSAILLYIPGLFFCSIKILKVLKASKSDTLILNDFDKPYSIFIKALLWKGNIYTFVRRRPSSFNSILSKCWITAALISSRKVIAVSNSVLNELPKKPNVIRIYNSIDTENFRHESVYPELNPIKFLFLGNYMAGKGQLEALEAFYIAYKKNKGIQLDFFGGDLGNKKNKLFKQLLIERAKKYQIDHVVNFGNYVDNIEELMQQYHVVLNLSTSESFSRVCIEAALSGRPVIATKSGGPQEIITHSETGFLVDIGDIRNIASYIIWFTENSSQIALMGIKAKSLVSKKFSYDDFKKKIQLLVT